MNNLIARIAHPSQIETSISLSTYIVPFPRFVVVTLCSVKVIFIKSHFHQIQRYSVQLSWYPLPVRVISIPRLASLLRLVLVLALSLVLSGPVLSLLLFWGQVILLPHSIISSKALLYWLNIQNPIFSRIQNKSILIVALAPENTDTAPQVMGRLSVDISYTGGLMLRVGLMRARDDHILQTNIEPVCCYHIGASEHIGNTLDTGILWYNLRHL